MKILGGDVPWGRLDNALGGSVFTRYDATRWREKTVAHCARHAVEPGKRGIEM